MRTRVEIVDPLLAADSAARILRSAWSPPSLHYSSEYLKWQFTFPGDVPPKVALAFAENDAVGCIGVTPRRFLLAGTSITAYVLSFVAVEPAARGRGVAADLYSTLLETIPRHTPVIAFAEPEGIGEALLLRCFSLASFQHTQLRSCRAAGCLPRAGARPSPVSATESIAYLEYSSIYGGVTDISTLWNAPSTAQWEHYLADPRGRSAMVIRDAGDKLIGTAMAVGAQIVSAGGVQRVPMLESVCLAAPSADALRAAFAGAQKEGTLDAVVVASNLSHMDEHLPRSAGARALPSIFNAHLFTRGIEAVRATSINIEVI